MSNISRREVLVACLCRWPLLAPWRPLPSAGKKMTLAIHQNTSNGAGYRKSLEGWARAGIKDVEITNILLDEFLKTDDLAAARRVITDLGLNLVQAATGVLELWEPNPNRAAALDNLKRRCEMYATMGLNKVYAATASSKKVTEEDYKAGPQNMHDAGEVARQFNMSLRIEFLRSSSFISTLPTSLKLTREAAHPNIAPDAGHLPFLVRPEQIRGPRHDSPGRNRPCAFPGCSGYAARDAGPQNADHSR